MGLLQRRYGWFLRLILVKNREEVQGIFEPIIQEVIKLVDGQIQAVQGKGKQVTVSYPPQKKKKHFPSHLLTRIRASFSSAASALQSTSSPG